MDPAMEACFMAVRHDTTRLLGIDQRDYSRHEERGGDIVSVKQ